MVQLFNTAFQFSSLEVLPLVMKLAKADFNQDLSNIKTILQNVSNPFCQQVNDCSALHHGKELHFPPVGTAKCTAVQSLDK